MPQKPRHLSSTTREAAWHNQLLDYIASLELKPGVGYRLISHPSGGFSIAIEPTRGGRSGGLNYRGDYDPEETYDIDDIVRVTSGEKRGVYIAVMEVPAHADGRYTPTYPEENQYGGVVRWHLWAFGPQLRGTCLAGTKQIYINASDDF